MNLVLFGPPGSGKGTQAVLCSSELGYSHISTGDLLRSAVSRGSALGLAAKGVMDKGGLVSDDIVVGLVEEKLTENPSSDFVLDGFPRTLEQAKALNSVLSKLGMKVDRVLSLSVPEQMLVDRLSGRRVCSRCASVFHVSGKRPKADGICDNCGGLLVQRADDKVDVIRSRLETYELSTAPVKDFYRSGGIFFEIDGVGDSRDVFGRLKVHIGIAEN